MNYDFHGVLTRKEDFWFFKHFKLLYKCRGKKIKTLYIKDNDICGEDLINKWYITKNSEKQK